MIDDLYRSVKATLYDRTTSPLFGAFAISWILWNHRLLIVLFSSSSITEKFGYIDTRLYPEFPEALCQLLAYPIITALVFLFGYPYPAKAVYRFWRNRQRELKVIRQQIEDETPLTVEESRTIRRQLIDIQTDYETQLRNRSDEVDRLKEAVAETQEALESARKATQQPQGRSSNPSESRVPSDDELTSMLPSSRYRLFFNPRKGPDASKSITFNVDGSVGEGQNTNEHSWRVKDRKLELIQADGDVHSRFMFIPQSSTFAHTNDPDTKSVRDQYIVKEQ